MSLVLRFVLLGLLAMPLLAGPVTVSVSASFTPGLTNGWSFHYVSGAPDLYLQQVTIDLGPTDLRFDTASGGYGSLSFLDVGGFNGTDVSAGLTPGYLSGVALDGGSVLVFQFSNFLPVAGQDSFQFVADLDHPNPTLQTLANCAGKTGFALLACNIANGARTGANDLLLAGAELGTSGQFAGALATFQFGGAGYETFSATQAFSPATLQSILTGLVEGKGIDSFDATLDTTTPEPTTLATFAAGLIGLFAIARRRRKV
jgi:hypothetical protein